MKLLVFYPIDIGGAGDMLACTFLYALAQGQDYRTTGEFARLVACKVVSQCGPRLKADSMQN